MLLVFVVVERSPIVWTTREGGPEELVVAEGKAVSMEGFEIGGVVGPIVVDIAITGMSNREDSGVDRRIGVSGSIRGGDRSIWEAVERVNEPRDRGYHDGGGRAEPVKKHALCCSKNRAEERGKDARDCLVQISSSCPGVVVNQPVGACETYDRQDNLIL